MRHLIDSMDLSGEEWNALYRDFEDILEHTGDYRNALAGSSMASLFYEPSTRTRFSFESAMLRLGGGVFGFSDPGTSSVKKGETLADTITMVSGYSDVVVMRHPVPGSTLAATLYSSVPVINAGDGGHCHPTQTLTDLATITKLRGGIDGLRIGLCGDLRYGRTVHSLLAALTRFPGVQVYLISPRELTIPLYLRKKLIDSGLKLFDTSRLEATLGQLDALYMTRIQRERFIDPLEYERLKGVYVLTAPKLRAARKDLIILHPLPRVDEIRPDVDADPRAKYFEQARLGMFIRMALLLKTARQPRIEPDRPWNPDIRICKNPDCITAHETYLPPLADENGICKYCEHID